MSSPLSFESVSVNPHPIKGLLTEMSRHQKFSKVVPPRRPTPPRYATFFYDRPTYPSSPLSPVRAPSKFADPLHPFGRPVSLEPSFSYPSFPNPLTLSADTPQSPQEESPISIEPVFSFPSSPHPVSTSTLPTQSPQENSSLSKTPSEDAAPFSVPNSVKPSQDPQLFAFPMPAFSDSTEESSPEEYAYFRRKITSEHRELDLTAAPPARERTQKNLLHLQLSSRLPKKA